MDWHKTFQCTFLNDMKFWKDALVAVLGVVDELLNSNEIIPGNYRIMQTFPAMLGAVTHILSGFVVKVAGSVCLAGQNISAVPLVAEDLENGAGVPDCISSLSLATDLCQSISDLLTGVSKEIKKEDETNDFCLIVIDGQMAGLIVVIAQQYWGQHDAVAKSHLNGGVHDGTINMGLFLCHGGCKIETHFRVVLECEDVFCFKEDAHWGPHGIKHTDDGYTVDDVSGKTRNALCDDEINFSCFGIGYHAIKGITLVQRSARNAFICVDLH